MAANEDSRHYTKMAALPFPPTRVAKQDGIPSAKMVVLPFPIKWRNFHTKWRLFRVFFPSRSVFKCSYHLGGFTTLKRGTRRVDATYDPVKGASEVDTRLGIQQPDKSSSRIDRISIHSPIIDT